METFISVDNVIYEACEADPYAVNNCKWCVFCRMGVCKLPVEELGNCNGDYSFKKVGRLIAKLSDIK